MVYVCGMKANDSTFQQPIAVNRLAKMSGVTIRTLHYYDQIGLLKPTVRTEAGYRQYGPEEWLRLQQILFYRELDMSLEVIRDVLDDPGFNKASALQNHRKELIRRKQRMDLLLQTIDQTLENLRNNNIMIPENLYRGLNRETAMQYRREARQKYGEKEVEHAEKHLMKMGKEGFQQLQAEFKACGERLFALRHENPASGAVQAEIRRHYQFIRQFWGTATQEDPQAEAYAGLGKMYTEDERFTQVGGVAQPEYAAFLSAAMSHFASHELASR